MNWLEYMDKDTFFHRLSPVTKILWFILVSIMAAVLRDALQIILLLIPMVWIWWKSELMRRMGLLFKNLLPILLFAFIMWITIGAFHVDNPTSTPLYQSGAICLETEDFANAIATVLRIFLMVSVFYTLIVTTNFSEIIYGLRRLKLPYPAAFGVGLVFQVIPNIVREFRTIIDAQRSRGLETDKGSLISRAGNYCLILVPLFIRVLGTAQNMTLSMYIYRLNFKTPRSSLKDIHGGSTDTAFLVGHILFYVLIAAIPWLKAIL